MPLKNKNILLGVTGGIACYKSCELLREIIKAGAEGTVIMTEGATKFVSPLTFETLSQKKVYTNIFEPDYESKSVHTEAGKNIDLIIIAPATANTIGKIANGIADNLLCAAIMAASSPVLICPSMHSSMYNNPIVQANIKKLSSLGKYHIVEPEVGSLASGDYGTGRFPPVKRIMEEIYSIFTEKKLKDVSIVVTAGPTREFFDSVRFLSNPSTGKMGYCLARHATRMGARVTLISGPTSLEIPFSVKLIKVESAEDLFKEVKNNLKNADILIMNAAVCDERPKQRFTKKFKKEEIPSSIDLERTKDILKELKKDFKNKIIVGFCAETENLLINARNKLNEKGMNILFANPVDKKESGFESDFNEGYLIDDLGHSEKLPLMSKDEIALKILNAVVKRIKPLKHGI